MAGIAELTEQEIAEAVASMSRETAGVLGLALSHIGDINAVDDTGQPVNTMDRAYGKDDLEVSIQYLTQYTPLERASFYQMLHNILISGSTKDMNDHELAILAWAPNDHQASQAVEQWRDTDGGPDLFVGNPAYYLEYVSHNGSQHSALTYLLDKDGWEEPGGLAGVTDNFRNMGDMLASPLNRGVTGWGYEYGEGRSTAGDSRLLPIIEATKAVRRSEFEELSSGIESFRPHLEAGEDIAETTIAMFAGARGSYLAYKWAAPRYGPTAIGWATALGAKFNQSAVGQVLNRWGNAAANVNRTFSEPTNRIAGSVRVQPGTRVLSYLMHRTGQSATQVLTKMANTRPGVYMDATKAGRFGAGPSAWAGISNRILGADVIIGASLIGLGATSLYVAATQAEEIDDTRLARLTYEEEHGGITQEEMAEKVKLEALAAEQKEIEEQQAKQDAVNQGIEGRAQDTVNEETFYDAMGPTTGTTSPTAAPTTTTTSPFINPSLNEADEEIRLDVTTTSIFGARVAESIADATVINDEATRRVEAQQELDAAVTHNQRAAAAAEADPDAPDVVSLPQAAIDQALVDISTTGQVGDPSIWETYMTEAERRTQEVMEAIGLDFYDPEVTGITVEQLNAEGRYDGIANGWTIIEDISSPKDNPRLILLPPEVKAGAYNQFYDEWVAKEEADIDQLLGGVPEGYMADTMLQPSRWPVNAQQAPGEPLRFNVGEQQIESWERDIYYAGSKETGPTVAAEYRQSDVLDMINSMSFTKVMEFQALAGKAGFYGTSGQPFTRGYMTADDIDAVSEVMGIANREGEDFWMQLSHLASDASRYKRTEQTEAASPSAPTRLPYSIPLSLRSIPGPKTVAEQAKAQFERRLGRQARPDELESIATELTGYHSTRNQELIALDMARYEGDNQGMITGAQFQAIEDPEAAAMFNIGEKWKDEINLNERRESNSTTFQRMLNATMGNRASVGNLTAAPNVQTVGRAQ